MSNLLETMCWRFIMKRKDFRCKRCGSKIQFNESNCKTTGECPDCSKRLAKYEITQFSKWIDGKIKPNEGDFILAQMQNSYGVLSYINMYYRESAMKPDWKMIKYLIIE